MSRLSKEEFRAMNSPLRRLLQRYYELPLLRSMGIHFTGKDILEIGCGSGYGAELMMKDRPRSYLGVDVMEEQIELACKRAIPGTEFRLEDAARLQSVADASMDLVVVFGILHHIPAWRIVMAECHRVLRPEGEIYLEEPDGELLDWFDRWSKWGHPKEARFSLRELENDLSGQGMRILRKSHLFGFGFYRAQRV